MLLRGVWKQLKPQLLGAIAPSKVSRSVGFVTVCCRGYLNTYVYIDIYIYVDVYTCIYTHHICVCACIYVCVYVHIYMYTYIYICYVCIHIFVFISEPMQELHWKVQVYCTSQACCMFLEVPWLGLHIFYPVMATEVTILVANIAAESCKAGHCNTTRRGMGPQFRGLR